MRLNAYIARATGMSRRAADSIIARGGVEINGEKRDFTGYDVVVGDTVMLNGRSLEIGASRIWVLMNKPGGCLTTRSDEMGRKTVMELLPQRLRSLFPVGRLDMDTSGVLLLTDDGETANRLLHPRFGVPRIYNVDIRGRLSSGEMEIARKGVILDGRRAVPSNIERVRSGENGETWSIELAEGRKREVKRLFAALGHRVLRLERTMFAGIGAGGLGPGEWRVMKPAEIARLKARLEEYVRTED